jgi:hypothetical protein
MNIQNQPYKFYVNPSPKTVDELVMSRSKVESWIDGPVKCTPEIFNLTGSFIFSRDRMKQNQFNQNNFMVPMTSANEGALERVVIGDIPQFKFFNYLALTVPLKTLQDVFDELVDIKKGDLSGNKEYDFELKYSHIFLRDRIEYIREVIALSLELSPKLVVVIDRNHEQLLSESWENGPVEGAKKNRKSLGARFDTDSIDIKDASEYIEKLVLIDFLYDNPITHYFIKFKKFPYPLKGGMAITYLKEHENLMIVWYYYYDQMKAKLAQGGQDNASKQIIKPGVD